MALFKDSCSTHGFAGHQSDCLDCIRAEAERERAAATEKQIEEDQREREYQARKAANRSAYEEPSYTFYGVIAAVLGGLLLSAFAAAIGAVVIPFIVISAAALYAVEKWKPEWAPKTAWRKGEPYRDTLNRTAMWSIAAGVFIYVGFFLSNNSSNSFAPALPAVGGFILLLGMWRVRRYYKRRTGVRS